MMYKGSMGEPDGYVRLPDPAPVLPAKEDVATAIFEVLKGQTGTTFLSSQIAQRLGMAYHQLPPDYEIAVIKWIEARYFAGGLEAITERLDRMEHKLDAALVYEYDPDLDDMASGDDDADGLDDNGIPL